MTNIVKFPAPAEAEPSPAVDYRRILAGTRSLWQVGIVNTEAYAIAAQVCWLFMTEQKPVVATTFTETTRRYVQLEDKFLAGPVRGLDKSAFTCGLIDLHTSCGLVNALDKKFFNPAGNPRQHFSIPHPMRNMPFWTEDSPIYFKVQNFTQTEYQEFIERQIQARLKGCTPLTLTKG